MGTASEENKNKEKAKAALGATKGATKGAVEGAQKGAQDGIEKEENRQNSNGRKVRFKDGVFKNFKDAIRNKNLKERQKALLFLKIKATIFGILAVLVFLALIIQATAEDTSEKATTATETVYVNSNTQAAEMYNSTGSLTLATEEDIEQASTTFLEKIEQTNTGYHNALSTKYSGKESNTVVSKVKNITSNFEGNETQRIDVVTDTPVNVTGAASPKDEKTIYEHILNAEKYNFNNIIWRSYQKSNGSLVASNISFTVDEDSKLKYPVEDDNASNGSELNIEFFLTKARPYLQSWYIPFDIIVGTQDAQSGAALNTDLAYEIITSAYHQIVMDRYKVEKLARKTNYLVYDKTTTTTTTTRNCAKYEIEETKKIPKGTACTKETFNTFDCDDYVIEVRLSEEELVNCEDSWVNGCSFGKLNKNVTISETVEKTYCTDTESVSTSEEKDIRESKAKEDKITYSWNYVITLAKMFDRAISNKYKFEPYYQHPIRTYNSFIAKEGGYAHMTVESYRSLEKTTSRADDITVEELDYNVVEEPRVDNTNSNWNSGNVVASIPEDAIKIGGNSTAVVKKVVEVTKNGKEYIDKYNWSDSLKFEESKSGIYNVDSVKDVTGDDLTASDAKYYNDLYASKDINIIDLMNSNNEIYNRYVQEDHRDTSTSNIGINKNKLEISYNVLKEDLAEVVEKYPLSGLMYGNSMGILEGLNLGNIAGASGINDSMVMVADAHLGYDIDQMLSLNHKGTFFRNHWCAMFVSYCMRVVEEKAGVNIPIPNYTGCTTFWRNYNSKPGFYDVQEWVSANSSGQCVQTDPTHIAPLSSIQPGDIILYCWTGAGDRDHTAIVKSVEKDASGNVTKLVSIDGNWGGSGVGEPSYNYSKVKYAEHVAGASSSYNNLSSIASFVSISTVMAEAEKGNIW